MQFGLKEYNKHIIPPRDVSQRLTEGERRQARLRWPRHNAKLARELIGILREANANVPPQLEEMSMFGGGGGGRSKSLLLDVLVAVR